MESKFINKSKNLTKKQQKIHLKSKGYSDIKYSGKNRGFYAKKI